MGTIAGAPRFLSPTICQMRIHPVRECFDIGITLLEWSCLQPLANEIV